MNFLRTHLSGLRATYLLSGMVLLALLVGCFTWINLHNQKRLIYAHLSSEALSTASFISEIAVQNYYYFDLEALRVLLKEVRRQEHIAYAYFFDAEGKVLTDGTSDDLMRYKFFASGFAQQAGSLTENRMAFSADTFDLLRPITLGSERYGALWLGYSLTELRAELVKARNRNLLLGFVAFLGLTLFIWLVVDTILKPIRRLTVGTRALAKGDFSHRIDVGRRDELGQLASSFNQMTDDLERASRELSASESRQKAIVAALPDMLFTFSKEGICLDYKLGDGVVLASDILGKELGEIALIPKGVAETLLEQIRSVLEQQESQLVEFNQADNFYEARLTRIDGASALILVRDVTLQKHAEASLRHKAFHDTLTGLANRTLFLERLEARLAQREREQGSFAVMILDLDGFKHVNDSLGHLAGDELLKRVAERFAACVAPHDTVARLGGDEFAILLTRSSGSAGALQVAERLLSTLKQPVRLGSQEIFVGTSIGIVLRGAEHTKPGDLMRDADVALYRAKALGRNRFETFDSELHVQAVARLELENDLHRALVRSEFLPYYQPVVSLVTGQIVGFEALARWQHPSRGLLAPDTFLGLAEETGQIVQIDLLILRAACKQIVSWRELTGQPLSLNANLSGHQFVRADLAEQLEAVLKESGLPPADLHLEITEGVLLKEPERIGVIFDELKSLEVKLYLDDFGTGYSSLSYLNRFPIDALKLERSFVRDMHKTEKRAHLVASVIELAHGQGLTVVAEGIENFAQQQQLSAWRCSFGQGYYFSKPLAAAEILSLLKPSHEVAAPTATRDTAQDLVGRR